MQLVRIACTVFTIALAAALPYRPVSDSHAAQPAHPTVVSEAPAPQTPHLLADSTIEHPLAFAVSQSGNTIYVGGKFQSVENAPRTVSYQRSHVFAFDAITGAVSETFVPVVNRPVFAILANGNSVYLGGEFGIVNGVTRRGLVKLDAVTGPWTSISMRGCAAAA